MGICFTLLAAYSIYAIEEHGLLNDFKLIAEQQTEIAKDQLTKTIAIVKSVAALYAASMRVDRHEFKKFTHFELGEKQGVQAIEWIPKVTDAERDEFETQARNDGLSNFLFTEQNARGEMVKAARRDIYFPVYFIEPLINNEAALGYDLASNPARLKAMNRARDTGRLQSTGRVNLVQETGKQYGILAFQPVYRGGNIPKTVAERRRQLSGFSLGVLRVGDIIGSSSTINTSRSTNMFVFDVLAPADQQRLYPPQSAVQSENDTDPASCITHGFTVGDRPWLLVVCDPELDNYHINSHISSLLTLFFGLMLSILMSLYIENQFRQRQASGAITRQLKSSESRLQQIMDNVGDAIVTANDSGIIQDANRATSAIFGYDQEELLGQHINMLLPDSEHKAHSNNLDRFIETRIPAILGGQRVESTGCRKDGSEFPVDISVTQNEDTFIASIIDISARKLSEEAQEMAVQRMGQFFGVTIEGIFFHDDGIIVDVNDSGARLTDRLPAELIGKSLFESLPPEYHAVGLKHIQSGSNITWEAEIIRKNGSRIPVEIQGRDTVYLGKPVRVVAIRDISSRVQAEKELSTLAAELTQLIDNANAPIFGIDRNGIINEWNKSAQKITGYSKDETLGKALVDDFITDEYKVSVKTVLDNALKGNQTENYEFPLYAKSGKRIDMLLNASTRRDINGDIVGVIGIGQDITERKQAEAEVIQASKLASLGEMATSVAHELNQPLNVIRMAAGNILRKIGKGPVDAEYLSAKMQRISAQTERAAAIITHMRMFGRKASEEPSPIHPCNVVLSALDLIGEQLRLAEIDVQVGEPPKECPYILGHQVQLEQVILNLITNARDAILSHDDLNQKIIQLEIESTDPETVKIIVEDNGGGIPENIIGRIFEPFFTTKKMGHGTGLGLSVSYGIIRDMGGIIEVSNTSQGAKFTITLPTVNAQDDNEIKTDS